jgi:serine protease AprX
MTTKSDSYHSRTGARRWVRRASLSIIGAAALLLVAQPGFGIAPTGVHAAKAPTTTTAREGSALPDGGSMALITESTGARAYWRAGYTGKGIDIAIIDSGTAPVNGLSAPGKVVFGPDLSFESQDPATRYLDTNGHGTHLAGIIAGRDDAATGNYGNDVDNFLGMAPDARLVSIKVADSQGRTDVTQVIAAIDWVVQHKTDNGMNIRVLLLAFSTNSTAPWEHDPLVFAAEEAWKHGIFVVISAGNDGPGSKTSGTLGLPAASPNLMTVGAADTLGTLELADDSVPEFSSGGTPVRRVDVVAAGAHVISLKAPNSYADRTFGATGAYGDRFFRGSGTSQSAAVMAGAAALVLQQRPSTTPQGLKDLFIASGTRLSKETIEVQGAGAVNLTTTLGKSTPTYSRIGRVVWSDGTGALDASRGSQRLVHNGVELTGPIDIFGHAFDSKAMATLTSAASSWAGGTWNGNQWTASSWSASSWSASSWSASSWSASSWSASSWSASSWSASSWSASSWSASSWSASSWSASSWSASSWSSAAWN